MTHVTKALIYILTAISIDRLCGLIPSRWSSFDPFPFYDLIYKGENVGIHPQYYVKAITVHIGWGLFMLAFRELSLMFSTTLHRLFIAFLVIECLALADFLLLYEQPFFNIGLYRVEFTDFKILGYAISIYLWRTVKL